MLGLGLALPSMNQRGGSGVAAFTPGAIHFDTNASSFGTTSALTAAGTSVTGGSTGAIADTAHLTVSYWVRGPTLSASFANRKMTSSFTDYVSNFDATSSELTKGINSVIDNANSASTLRTNLSDSTPTAANYGGVTNFTTDVWRHILYSMDGSPASTSKYFSLYIDGVKQGAGGITGPSTSPFLAGVSNSGGFNLYWPYSTSGQFDLAEVFVDFTISIVDSSNNISAANIAKFISGGLPVNLGVKGDVPLGRTPEIYISPRPSVSGIVNRGTVTGLTASNLYNAAYGPGGAVAAAHKVMYAERLSAAATSITTTNIATGVKAGDVIIQFIAVADSAFDVDHAFSTPTGYTVLDSVASLSTGTGMSSKAVWKYAATDGESTAASWTWTNGVAHNGEWMTIVIGSANQTNPFDAHAAAARGGAPASFIAPTITTTVANTIHYTVYFTYDPVALPVPAGTSRYLTGGASLGADAAVYVNFDNVAAAGAVNQTTTNPNGNQANVYSFAVKQ